MDTHYTLRHASTTHFRHPTTRPEAPETAWRKTALPGRDREPDDRPGMNGVSRYIMQCFCTSLIIKDTALQLPIFVEMIVAKFPSQKKVKPKKKQTSRRRGKQFNGFGRQSSLPSSSDLGPIPETSFRCADQPFPGLYADVEANCQVGARRRKVREGSPVNTGWDAATTFCLHQFMKWHTWQPLAKAALQVGRRGRLYECATLLLMSTKDCC